MPAEENNIVEPRALSDRSENCEVKFNLSNVSKMDNADLSSFFIWFRCLDDTATQGP